jgi:hypothetical protein
LPPDDIRLTILQQEGEWTLILDREESNRSTTVALKLLRQALNLPLSEVGKLRRLLPGPVATGTRAEMDRLLSILAAEGVRASISKTPSRTTSLS